MTPQQFEILLPYAVAWVVEQERIVLQRGVPLNESQVIDAKLVGIVQPERVRLLRVARIPPPPPGLMEAAAEANLISPTTEGMTVRYGIFIREDRWGHRGLLLHEFVHTMQYECLGGVEQFLRPYLFECFTPPGYPHGPMEREAVTTSKRLCA